MREPPPRADRGCSPPAWRISGGSNWSVVDRPSLSTTLVPHACRAISRGVMVAFRSEPPQTCFGPRYFGCYESHTGGRSEPTTPKMRLEETLALTPALSPRRGGSTHRTREFSRPLVWHCFIGLTSAATNHIDLANCGRGRPAFDSVHPARLPANPTQISLAVASPASRRGASFALPKRSAEPSARNRGCSVSI